MFQDSTINYILAEGVSEDKLFLGVALFGRQFVVKSHSTDIKSLIGHDVIQERKFSGRFTKSGQWIPYNEVM